MSTINTYMKDINRIVAFGCSHTAGQGIFNNDTLPSNYAWPAHVAKILNCKLNNQGELGGSVKLCSYKILNFKFKLNDLVIICWPDHYRDTIIDRDGDLHTINPNVKSSKAKVYYRIIPNENLEISNFMYPSLTNDYLTHKNIKHLNLFVHKYKTLPKFTNGNEQLTIQHEKHLAFLDFTYKFLPDNTGDDGSHFNHIVHENYGKLVYKYLKNLYPN